MEYSLIVYPSNIYIYIVFVILTLSEYSVSLTDTTASVVPPDTVEVIVQQQLDAFNSAERSENEKRPGKEKHDKSTRAACTAANPYRAPKVSTSIHNMSMDRTEEIQAETNTISLTVGQTL